MQEHPAQIASVQFFPGENAVSYRQKKIGVNTHSNSLVLCFYVKIVYLA